jgi:glycerol uptake facilitator-like aquaporin
MINNKYLAEFIGTAILVLVITGSGIMGYDLSRGNLGIALLINSIATGIALFILITIFINISGAHFNPSSNTSLLG